MPIYLGIDWSHTHHDACFLDGQGQVLSRVTVPHSAEGLAALDASREKLGVSRADCRVGLETAYSIVIDFLWACEYPHIFVIPPGAVKGARRRYRQTNAHTDQFDAWVIADVVRTDPQTLQPWRPDTLEVFTRFARGHLYRQPARVLTACFARLQASYPVASPETVAAYQAEATWLARHLSTLEQKKTELRALQSLFTQHPDYAIFDSLPGVGDFLAPALLAKFGDDRARFPDAASVQCLAGTCPVTEQSGHSRRVFFRQACDHEFRQIAQQWAKASLGQSTWAATYWQSVQARSRSKSHAYRCLANRWLAIAWKCWQTHQPYDEAYHLQHRAQRLAKSA